MLRLIPVIDPFEVKTKLEGFGSLIFKRLDLLGTKTGCDHPSHVF